MVKIMNIKFLMIVLLTSLIGCKEKPNEKPLEDDSASQTIEKNETDPCKEDPHSKECFWKSDFKESSGKQW